MRKKSTTARLERVAREMVARLKTDVWEGFRSEIEAAYRAGPEAVKDVHKKMRAEFDQRFATLLDQINAARDRLLEIPAHVVVPSKSSKH